MTFLGSRTGGIGGVVFAGALLATASALAPRAMAQQARQSTLRPESASPSVIVPVLWQQDGPPPRRRARPRRPLPPNLIERLKKLTPEQREKVLENNRRFQQLPPERQELLRERLRQLQELSPEEREMVEQRFAIFSNLTPEQQKKARRIYQDRWRAIPAERRRALLQEFRRLRALNAEQRKQRMESEELKNQFSGEERDLLAQLIAL